MAQVFVQRVGAAPEGLSPPDGLPAFFSACSAAAFPAHAPRLVRIVAVVADQMCALGRNVLGELGQEVQRQEDLEIPLRPGCDPVSIRVGKGSARLLLLLVRGTLR